MSELATPPLRRRSLWLKLGWTLLVLVVIASLVPGPLPRVNIANFDKLEHAVAFALLMTWFGALHARDRHLRIALALLGLGAAIELAQGATGWRDAEFKDWFADAVGIVLGALLARHGAPAVFARLDRALGAAR